MEEKAMKRRFAEWMVKHSRRYEDEEEKAMRYNGISNHATQTDVFGCPILVVWVGLRRRGQIRMSVSFFIPQRCVRRKSYSSSS
jgi:hypothetical protein